MAYGTLGINPYSVVAYFKYLGYKVTITYSKSKYDSVAKKNTANINFYFHSSGGHFVALKWSGGKFKGYNTYSNSIKVDDWSTSISGFMKKEGFSGGMLISIKK